MTIRFTCTECSSVLKIKDELAGTKGRCPKCKTEFVVPEPSPDTVAAKSPNGTVSITSVPTQTEVTPPKNHAPDEHQNGADEMHHAEEKPHSEEKHHEEKPHVAEADHVKAAPLAIPEDEAPAETHNGGAAKAEHAHSASLTLPDDEDDELDSPVLPAGLPLVTAEKLADSTSDLAALTAENDAGGEVGHDESMRHSLGFDDDDELDSPPVLAGEPIVAPQRDLKATSETANPKTDKKNKPVPESFRTSEKPAPAKQKAGKGKGEDELFDAFAFLMNDQDRKGGNVASGDSDLILTDDSDYDLLGRPTPVKPKSTVPVPKATAAPIARPAPEKVDLATAAKMMKKAIKDAQTDANKQHQLDAKPGYDYTLFFREFGLRGLYILGTLVAGIILSVMAGRYLAISSLKTPPLARLSGTVTLDGQPVANAMIYFAPYEMEIPGTRRERSRTSIGRTDDKGAFRMMYSPDDHIEGVRIGKNRVWVVHFGQKGSDVPQAWSEAGMREQMIESGKSYVPFDISMTTESKSK